MRVRYSPRAQGDIERIFQYLDQLSPSGAHNVLQDVYAAVQLIADQPEAAERTDDPDVRVKIVLRYRYKIFYRISADAVEVLHIRHSARRPWRAT